MSTTTTRPPLKLHAGASEPATIPLPAAAEAHATPHITGQCGGAAPPTLSLVERIMAEGSIGMAAAATLIGSFRNGRPTHSATLTRWASRGVRLANGQVIRLESVRVAGRLVTSKQAVIRFLEAQQREHPDEPQQHTTDPSTPAAYRKAAERASRELDEALNSRR